MASQQSHVKAIEDIFDSSLNLEETHFKDGYKLGYADGIASGKEDARELGLKHGFQVGEELGFYKGCVDVWNSAIRIDPTRFSPRTQKRIKNMEELVRRYPISEPENESLQEVMDSLRLEFRAVCMNLHMKLEYSGYPKPSSEVYISESKNRIALESIEQAAKLFQGAAIVYKFEDEAYNRVGYTLVSKLPPRPSLDLCPLGSAVLAMVETAFEAINLELHCGTHPRLGVVDHICFHPLASSSLDQTAGIAKSLAADVGSRLQVPTYLYGAAHEGGRTLDSIRREFGYFKPTSTGNQWAGGKRLELLPLQPDEGPEQGVQAKGVVTIGATGWVDNYNVPVFSTDISAARRIAKRVSGRGGGLPTVQAMALAHGDDVTEVACNLLEPSRVGGDQVQLEVERLAKEEGLAAGNGYYTDFSQMKLLKGI